MDRREFIQRCLFWGAAAGATLIGGRGRLFAQNKPQGPSETPLPDMVAIKGGEPEAMFEQGIKAFGGIGRFVKPGQTVVVKPNIGWNKRPELAATTNPKLVKRIVEYCLEAGAAQVYVFDNPVSYWKSAYSVSGIENAVKEAGGKIVPGTGAGVFQKVKIPGAVVLTEAAVNKLVLQADVFINVPVLKDHGSSQVTISMKNLMGIVEDREFFHARGLHECIVDINRLRPADLIVVDAYRVVTDHGPQPYDTSSVSTPLMQIIATDPVAADTAAAKILGRDPSGIPHIVQGERARLGTMKLETLDIKRLTL